MALSLRDGIILQNLESSGRVFQVFDTLDALEQNSKYTFTPNDGYVFIPIEWGYGGTVRGLLRFEIKIDGISVTGGEVKSTLALRSVLNALTFGKYIRSRLEIIASNDDTSAQDIDIIVSGIEVPIGRLRELEIAILEIAKFEFRERRLINERGGVTIETVQAQETE